MNENLNLVEILKDCPKGAKLYSPIYGDVELVDVSQKKDEIYPIRVKLDEDVAERFTGDGRLDAEFSDECMLFPNEEQRDWSKFKVKKLKFDPNTLKPFDKVLVRDSDKCRWVCAFYSHTREDEEYKYKTFHWGYKRCIPYNNDTKHLLDTKDEAPEYYRY